jgi:transposase-like protein
MLRFERERTHSKVVLYSLYLYFLGLSFRHVSLALDPFVKRSHMSVWKWVQRYEPPRIFDVKRIPAFLVDETYVKIDSSDAWVWVAVEPVHR